MAKMPNDNKIAMSPLLLALLLPIFFINFGTVKAVSPGSFVERMEELPFMAKFPPYSWPSAISCSATIIGRRHVMLVAHCLKGPMRATIKELGVGVFHQLEDIQPGLNVSIFVGAPDIRSNTSIEVPVKAFAVPPAYPFPTGPYVNINPLLWIKDMAIAELARPLDFSDKVQPIKLVKKFPAIKPNDKRVAYMAGWGGDYPYQLRVGTAKLEADPVCVNASIAYYDHYNANLTAEQLAEIGKNMSRALKEGMLCTSPNPSAIEGGNGGGPLALKVNGKFYQIGILENTLSAGTTDDVFFLAKFVSSKVDVGCKWIEQLTGVKCVKLPREKKQQQNYSGKVEDKKEEEEDKKEDEVEEEEQ